MFSVHLKSVYLHLTMKTKRVAKSASRALGFLICNDKALGGMPFECFTKCYNSLVQPVIDYFFCMGNKGIFMSRCCAKSCLGHGAWGLGLGKYAQTLAVDGGMGWLKP